MHVARALFHVLLCLCLVRVGSCVAITQVVQTTTFVALERRATYRVVATTNTQAYTSPQLWVASGLVDCGSPLYPNPCTSFEYTTTSVSTLNVWETETSVLSEYYWTTISKTKSERFSPVVIPTKFTSTDFAATITADPQGLRLVKYDVPTTVSDANIAPGVPPITTATSTQIQSTATSVNTLPRLARRTPNSSHLYCLGIPLNEDFKTNSLSAVCNFVSNAQDVFVSLAPTSAAYMPSWLDYLVTFIVMFISVLCLLSRTLHDPPDGNKSAGLRRIATVFVLLFALIRTILAIYLIGKYSKSFDALPFISPFLWVDWFTVGRLWGGRVRTYLLSIVVLLWAICLWLCLGYSFLGYGVRQYEVLELSEKCDRQYKTSWQTDPRRVIFLDLHFVLFGLASVAIFEGWRTYQRTSRNTFRIPFPWGRVELHKAITVFLCSLLLLGLAGATVYVGFLNNADYLVLEQNGCYASYVSSRSTYLSITVVDWPMRLAEFFGINI